MQPTPPKLIKFNLIVPFYNLPNEKFLVRCFYAESQQCNTESVSAAQLLGCSFFVLKAQCLSLHCIYPSVIHTHAADETGAGSCIRILGILAASELVFALFYVLSGDMPCCFWSVAGKGGKKHILNDKKLDRGISLVYLTRPFPNK